MPGRRRPAASRSNALSQRSTTPATAPRTTNRCSAPVAMMRKVFTATVNGQSSTIFTAAFDQATGTGTYLALESFQAEIDGKSGCFVFGHSATTTGTDRLSPIFVIVPTSGTGELTGIAGTGELVVDPDGTHRLELDYQLPG
ncbi:MAG: DUF3224 domain-containing protein [Micropruina sp.]|uniref:DUF3224 domain-containing protein n=1 Tax=Micropruina sp. TaxID=2737536 RepID=UPI0039E5D2C8